MRVKSGRSATARWLLIRGALRAHGRTVNDNELMDLFEMFITYYAANIANTSRPYPGVIASL